MTPETDYTIRCMLSHCGARPAVLSVSLAGPCGARNSAMKVRGATFRLNRGKLGANSLPHRTVVDVRNWSSLKRRQFSAEIADNHRIDSLTGSAYGQR
jgi:hypothetical protein